MEFILKVPLLGDIPIGEQEVIVGVGEIVEIPSEVLEELREQVWLEFISNPKMMQVIYPSGVKEARFMTIEEKRSHFNNIPAIKADYFYVSGYKIDYFKNIIYIQLSTKYVAKQPSSIQTINKRRSSSSNNNSDGDLLNGLVAGVLLGDLL